MLYSHYKSNSKKSQKGNYNFCVKTTGYGRAQFVEYLAYKVMGREFESHLDQLFSGTFKISTYKNLSLHKEKSIEQ